jgi:hypothetical protein
MLELLRTGTFHQGLPGRYPCKDPDVAFLIKDKEEKTEDGPRKSLQISV